MSGPTPPTKPARGLGRGLDALLPSRPPAPAPPAPPAAGPAAAPNVFSCAIEKISPQRGQPRQHFDAERLAELAQSILEHGLLEPLVVRRRPGTDAFELIAGERRWRAAQKAGLREVLVVVRDVTPNDAFELALIENVQREDLDPIELAEALDRLIRDHAYTQETLAKRIGKDRSTIANALRLLRLPAPVRAHVVQGRLSEGHARALLGAPDDAIPALAEKVIQARMNVRQAEALVRSQRGGKPGAPPSGKKSPGVRDLEARFARKLGTKVEVRDRAGKGEILIRYSSLDELDRLIDLLL
ncbi:MAG: ParB/RepB/Spo0J family partition protein [Polyangiaceae bacterium]|nr:ParB/RepB/Spo0J family partition protein [Polyangiaceae bacterium]